MNILTVAVRCGMSVFLYIKNDFPEKAHYKNLRYRKNVPMMLEMLELRDSGELNEAQMCWFLSKGKEELYDCENDPHNLENLAEQVEYDSVLQRMRQRLQKSEDEFTDFGKEKEATMIAQMWPNNQQPRTNNPVISCQKNRVELSCPNEFVSISFCISDKEKIEDVYAEKWYLWQRPFAVPKGKYLHVLAERIGYKRSEIVTKK